MVLAEIVGWDMVVIAVVVALLFGGSKLPQLARSLGSAKGEFERGLKDGAHEVSTASSDAAASAAPAAARPDTSSDGADVERRLAAAEARRLAAEAELARLRAAAAPTDDA